MFVNSLCFYAMSEYARKPENKSRTLDAKPRISRQIPVDVLLQCHNVCTRSHPSVEERIQQMVLPLWANKKDKAAFIRQVLDDNFPGRTMLRVLKKGTTLQEYKERVEIYINMSQEIINKFCDRLNDQDLNMYIEDGKVNDLFFLLYNSKISKYAEPQGGKLTKLYVVGEEYRGIPGDEPDIGKIMDEITAKAQAKKQEMESIPIQILDVGNLH